MEERYAIMEEVKDVLKNNYCRVGYVLFFDDNCKMPIAEVLYNKCGVTVNIDGDDSFVVTGLTKEERRQLEKTFSVMSVKLNTLIAFTHWLEVRDKRHAISLDCKEYGSTDGLIKAFIRYTSENEVKVQPMVYEYHD